MTQISDVRRVALLVLIVVFSLLLVSGCAMKNQTIAEEKRVILTDKTKGAEVYSSGPLTVNYEYKRSGDKMTMSGSIGFRQSVDSLDVRIFFLADDGLVLDKKLIYSSGFRSFAARDSTRTFRLNLEIPAGTVGFSFDEVSRARTSMR